jgi:signal peptidase complex subunit 1
MDALLDQARDVYEGEIVSLHPSHEPEGIRTSADMASSKQDFRGQSLADFLTTFLLVATSILAVIVGFTTQDIYKTLYIGLGGTTLTSLLVVPQWPFYNKKPELWLPARVQKAGAGRNVDLGGVQIEVDGQRVG